MRLIQQAEQAFIRRLVEETRKIVRDESAPAKQRVRKLQAKLIDQAHRALTLRLMRSKTMSPVRIQRIESMIAVREKAVTYLNATAKWILHVDKHPRSLRQMPRIFADPGWQPTHALTPKPQADEVTFMEFSS